MTWFKVDDTAHSHPKILAATNAAVGLWLRCGAYAAQHLTDGIVPGPVAAMYGTAPQIKKLVRVGLWHPHGHTCLRCPQPSDGDFQMHDYLAYNPSRADVVAGRERAAEKKRKQRHRQDPTPDPPANRPRNGDDSSANRERIERESKTIHTPVSGEHPGHNGASPGDSQGPRARAFPTRPDPSFTGGPVERERHPSDARAREPLSLIPEDWTPSEADRTAATADITRLGPEATTRATQKFIAHHRARGDVAADFGPLWRVWLSRERPERAGAQGAFLVAVPGGQATPTPPSYRDRLAELDAIAAADREGDTG
ncbi:hypothetical protein GCM10010400_58200 [Streptomyces aculeolatus]|uniref:hypothetical protein n=1 Tax=Streptomyces aculeolatus TaxID=270689 RepID=UPI001CEC167F|nr:hypothetical protein [Streptomyces aculeolatus]